MEAPPGIDPNASRQGLIIGVVTFVLSVTFLAVAIRTYTRGFFLRQFGMDDWAAIGTFCLIFVCGVSVAINTRNGFGKHVYFLNPDQIKDYLRTFYVTVVFYNASLAGIKMTFLLQYWRVLTVQHMRKYFIAAMVLVGGWSVSQMLVMIFNCTPIPAFWDDSVEGTCIPNYPLWYINAGGNIVTDLLVFVLPLPAIGNLKLAKGQKLVLLGIFCLGFFTCTISFIRIRFLHLAEDFTWENVESAGWSVGELCSGLLCACLPTFRPLVSRFIPALSSRLTKSSRYQNYGGFSTGGKTANASRLRDVELGVAPTHAHGPNTYTKRRTESSDSKADLYGTASYDFSPTGSPREGGLPIQGLKQDEYESSSERVPSPIVFRQSTGHAVDYDPPRVETRIETGRKLSVKEASPPGRSIEVKCDIQVTSERVEARTFS
ncbi:Satratoxin biosynthesis SC1 cluster protein 4 [Colletotrichum orbiculare MAFF 240422]|uniref:Satratoxin biosynthesis SC1 cluster protein 4 n=1 Tax=Colletotrichum orbiculare (strain 104-T / ATCC 96160 / CBS 514.97 / LARS 414 / MAFF 240422) TaxID=1213857 RepID=N4VPU3_COLOR|nr:Satratoxin biosynthesis SC1 cluster protein 4 [Colletotrichum orbiculare MAFF 240422]